MTEGRDIAGFALPFAAGTLAASLIPASFTLCMGLSASAAAILLTILLMMGKAGLKNRETTGLTIGAAAFMAGITCLAAASSTSVSSIHAPSAIARTSAFLCERVKDAVASVPFSESGTSALITALLTGDRSALPVEITEAFRASGASHILALSGLHLGIVYAIFTRLTSWAGGNPYVKAFRSAAAVSFCLIYTFGTGAGESMTRAFLFILLKEAGSLMHRKTDLKEITMAALVIQLATDPLSIRSVSFQLSYAAMAGIAFIHPHLNRFWPDDGRGPVRKIWESASLSISCQLTTGPLAWLYFRSFPRHFLLTNLIAVPLTGLIIPASILTTALCAADACPDFVIAATERLVQLLTGALRIIAQM